MVIVTTPFVVEWLSEVSPYLDLKSGLTGAHDDHGPRHNAKWCGMSISDVPIHITGGEVQGSKGSLPNGERPGKRPRSNPFFKGKTTFTIQSLCFPLKNWVASRMLPWTLSVGKRPPYFPGPCLRCILSISVVIKEI
jgi:hypothetical protein